MMLSFQHPKQKLQLLDNLVSSLLFNEEYRLKCMWHCHRHIDKENNHVSKKIIYLHGRKKPIPTRLLCPKPIVFSFKVIIMLVKLSFHFIAIAILESFKMFLNIIMYLESLFPVAVTVDILWTDWPVILLFAFKIKHNNHNK